jgi:hypothetical protein
VTARSGRTIGDIASLVRSKNAGPFWITLDVFCDSDDAYDRVSAPGVVTEQAIAHVYRVDPTSVRVYHLPELRIVKVSFPRRQPQGSVDDRDMHAGQQHIPLSRLLLTPRP